MDRVKQRIIEEGVGFLLPYVILEVRFRKLFVNMPVATKLERHQVLFVEVPVFSTLEAAGRGTVHWRILTKDSTVMAEGIEPMTRKDIFSIAFPNFIYKMD